MLFRPSVASTNYRAIIFLTHAIDFPAQIVLRDIEKHFDICPNAEVDRCLAQRAIQSRLQWPQWVTQLLVWSRQHEKDDCRRDAEGHKSDAASFDPELLPCDELLLGFSRYCSHRFLSDDCLCRLPCLPLTWSIALCGAVSSAVRFSHAGWLSWAGTILCLLSSAHF